MALDPTKIAKIAYQVFMHGPDMSLSLQGGVGTFPFQETDHIVSSGEGGRQRNLAGRFFSGAVLSAGVTLTVDNYLKTTGGGIAAAVNVLGIVVGTNTGVFATGHTDVVGRVVTGTDVQSGGTLIMGLSRSLLKLP